MCSAARVMFFAATALLANYIIRQMKRARTFVRALWLFSWFLLNFLYRHYAFNALDLLDEVFRAAALFQVQREDGARRCAPRCLPSA